METVQLYKSTYNNLLQQSINIITPKQCSYQVSTSYTLQFLRYSLEKNFIGQGHYGKV